MLHTVARRCVGPGLLLLGCLLSSTALAQATSAAPDLPATGAKPKVSPQLEEIVVTADRHSYGADFVQAGTFRNARQIDTPLTVSVISQELIQSQQARTVLDALRNTAGVTTASINSAIYNNLAIRGITVENRGNYRLNGVLPIVNLVDLPLEDKERVEALKGASALYYGFTTPAGIINLTSKRPTKDPLTAIEIFGNGDGAIGGHLDFSRSYGAFGLRINYVNSTVETGIDKTDGNRHLFAAALDWRPTDKLLIQFDAEDIYKTVTEPFEYQLPAAVNGVIPLPPLLNPRTNLGSNWMHGSGEEYNLLGTVRYAFSPSWSGSFYVGESNLSRNRRYSSFSKYNLTTGQGTLNVTLTNGNMYDNVTYRGEVAGTFATGPLVHELLFGASRNIRDSRVPTNPIVTFSQNLYNPVAIPETALPASVIPNPSEIDDIGYYVFDRIGYHEWLQFLVGYRKTDYSDISLTSAYKATPDSFSYGLVLKPRKWISLYATYIEGLEAGGVAPANAVNANEVLPANQSTQVEFGLKVEPRRGLLFTVSHFDIDRASAFLNSSRMFVQDGTANFAGWELSLTGEITHDLSIYASSLFLDAKQVTGSSVAVTGTRIENTAEMTDSLAVEYRLPKVPGLRFTAAIYYVGDRAVNAANNAFVPGYTTYDLGASYATMLFQRPVTLRVNAENITDERYWAATGSSLLAPGLPGQVKLSVLTRF